VGVGTRRIVAAETADGTDRTTTATTNHAGSWVTHRAEANGNHHSARLLVRDVPRRCSTCHGSSAAATGVELLVVVPFPSCPYALYPQQ
jgi:hypothetical protein